MDMAKYVKLYVSESQDRLQRMDGLLLTLEQNSADRTAIDTLFREAHSIKGMSASMGYEELSRIAHRMEDLLELVRGGKGAIDPRGVDLLFQGVDLLRRGVEEVAAGRPPSVSAEPYVTDITPLIERGPGPAAETPAAPAATPDRTICRVEIKIAPDAPLPSARAYLTLRRARDVGEVVESVPTLTEVQAGQFTGDLSIQLATPRPPGEVQAFLASLPDVASVVVRPEAGARATAPVRSDAPPSPRSVEPVPAHPTPAAPGPSGPPPAARPPRTMMRVDTRLLDELMDQVGELVTANGALDEASQVIDSPRLHETAGRLGGLIKALQLQAMQLRLMPLEFIADRFPRAVRDLAQRRGKEVSFEVVGKDTELDRAILDAMVDPILHILRNAVDHGIEPVEDRLRHQKPRVGTIRLAASKEHENVVIRISDDGRGIDPNQLRRLAVERGLLTREQATQLPDSEARMLITLPGFSTAEAVSDVSGRGVGMDVVRGAMESLRGSLVIDSEIGRGTTITLKLPLTLLIAPVLLVGVAGERYALPVSSVEQVLEVGRDEIQRTQGQEMIAREGGLIPFVQLRPLLGLPPSTAGSLPAVLSEMRGRRVGVAVDRLIGYREVVVKPLDKVLKGARGFSGVTILGDGGAVLLLDLNTL